MDFKVTVIGTGYVGLTTGVTLAFLGYQVTCVDKNINKLNQLRKGNVPFHEPYMQQLLELTKGKINFSNNINQSLTDSKISFIAVGTPSNQDGSANLSAVESVAREIGKGLMLGQEHLIINKSTVPIGTSFHVENIIKANYKERHSTEKLLKDNIMVASNPEFLREGSALYDSLYPDRILIGSKSPTALKILRDLYSPLTQQTFSPPSFLPRPEDYCSVPIVETDITSAETIKYAANAFLATKISFINEISGLAELVGADIQEIAKGIGLDKRIGTQFLQAGIGWGGSCFGKDTKALISSASEYGYHMPLLEATIAINQRQRSIIISKLQKHFKLLKGRRVALLGLTFKPNTNDLRDAPSLDVISALNSLGSKVIVHDPIAMQDCQNLFPSLNVTYAATVAEVAQNSDALALITDWEEYSKIDWHHIAKLMSGKLVVDGRNFLISEKVEQAGLIYQGVGK